LLIASPFRKSFVFSINSSRSAMTFEMIFLTSCQGKPLIFKFYQKHDGGNPVDIDVNEAKERRKSWERKNYQLRRFQ